MEHGFIVARRSAGHRLSSYLRRSCAGKAKRLVLVTPVEKVGIKVDDAPFLAVGMRVEEEADGRRLTFRTNVEDMVTVNSEHPFRFELGASGGLKPYVRVRGEPLGADQARSVL